MNIQAKETNYLQSKQKIKIFNSLGSIKQEFIPIDKQHKPTQVKMYVCGLTPYDHPHLGHALSAIRFDIIRNYLEYRGLKVLYCENVTDIDDKIINRSLETGEDPLAISRRYTEEYYQGTQALGIRKPDFTSKVTEHLTDIKEFIEKLIALKAAYVTDDGNVYYDVIQKSDYGKLSRQNVAELYESVRKQSDEKKKAALDFALWKRDESTSLSSASIWGTGRPGWHIECSAMIHSVFGDEIDIHGGGLDLKFPHHENEIAQSESYTGGKFVRVWMHSGLLTMDGAKMSKSLKNFISIRDALDKYGAELIRFSVLRFHYRSAINFSDQLFLDNLNTLCHFQRIFELFKKDINVNKFGVGPRADKLISDFEAAMNDDFNTAGALVVLSEALNLLRAELKILDKFNQNYEHNMGLCSTILQLGKIMGIFNQDPSQTIAKCLQFSLKARNKPETTVKQIEDLLKERTEARRAKNFEKSDQIRASLKDLGIEILDIDKEHSTWEFSAT